MDNKENINYNKILIINLGGIGDILLSTPALKALRNFYPQSNISLLVVPRVYDLVKDLPYINDIFVFHFRFKNKSFLLALFKDLNALLILRRKQFDLAVNMRTLVSKGSALKIKFLLDIIRPKLKAGRDTQGKGIFFDIKIPETDVGQKYEMDYDIETVRSLGIDVQDKSIDFKIDEEDFKKINQILEKEGIGPSDILICVHPGGKPSHRWPIKNFAEVINEISKKIVCKFVITGEKDEVDLGHELMKTTDKRLINFIGQLDLKELGAAIRRCSLYISNDTAPIHIAALLKTPLLAIFGGGDLTRFDPRHISDKTIVLYKKQDCAPCNRTNCDSIKCLKAISPEEVVQAALNLLKAHTHND